MVQIRKVLKQIQDSFILLKNLNFVIHEAHSSPYLGLFSQEISDCTTAHG